MTNTTSWHRAILVLFSLLGLTNASLLARLPEVRESVGATTAEIGFILLGFAIGSLVGLSVAGRIIERLGTRLVVSVGFAVSGIAVIAQAIAIGYGSKVGLFAGFVLLGMVGSAADVALNVSGSALEQRLGKTVLPMLHAGFSVGTLVGVGIGTLGTATNFSLVTQLAVLAVGTSAIAVAASRRLVESIRHGSATDGAGATPQSMWRSPTVLGLSAGIFALTLAEGAANDWIVLSMVDEYKETRANGAIAYGMVMVAMIVTRVIGGRISDRLGRGRTLQLFSVLGAIGIVIVILAGTYPVALAGAALWGAGVALAFPLFLSAAGEGDNAARRVSFVASAGYMAFLVGPPVLGVVAQSIGLLSMFWILVAFVVVAVFVSPAAATPAGRSSVN